jgi:hypothetical protein
MKTSLLRLAACVLFFAASLFAQTAAPSPARDARAKKAGEERLAYAASAEYNPYDTKSRECRKIVTTLLEKKQAAEAIAEAQKGLAQSKYDIDLLILLATAYRDAGDPGNAERTNEQWIALVDSILRSGTGRDFGGAYRVISVAEEYIVARMLGVKITGQALQGHAGSSFDVVQTKNPRTGEEQVLYFNVDLPTGWLNKQLAAKK